LTGDDGVLQEAKTQRKRHINIVTRTPIARQHVDKQIPVKTVGKQSIARLCSNRLGCVFYAVCAKQQ
jgi:hypothetical protein